MNVPPQCLQQHLGLTFLPLLLLLGITSCSFLRGTRTPKPFSLLALAFLFADSDDDDDSLDFDSCTSSSSSSSSSTLQLVLTLTASFPPNLFETRSLPAVKQPDVHVSV